MEAVIAFLDREARIYNNADAAIILADWKRTRRMPDTAFYAISRIRKAAQERDRLRLAQQRAKVAARAATLRLEAVKAARSRLRAKLGFPD